LFFKYSKSRNSCRCGPTLPVLYDDRYTYHIGLVPAFYFYTIHLLVSAHWVGCGSSVIREAVPRIRARQGPTPHSTSVPQGMGWSAIPRTGRETEDADVAASGTAPERQARPPGAACLVAAVVGTPSPSSGHDKSGVRHAAPGTLVTGRSAAPTMSRGADGADVAAS
jgi:hypothetical protein